MPRPKKSKAEDLARVRNNQRKCRERRRDYLAELEQKLKCLENEKVQWSADCEKLQAITEKFRQENATLKKLLGLSSICENFQNASPTDGMNRLWIDCDDSLTQTQRLSDIDIEPGILSRKILEDKQLHELSSTHGDPLLLNPNGTELDKLIACSQLPFGFTESDAKINTPTLSSPIAPHVKSTELEIPTGTSFQPTSSLTLWPMLTEEMAREDRTMLCSIAYRLILHFNRRRFSDSEINRRICHGFRQGRTQLERCRIDNEVLFAVLSDMSS